jgi:Zn-dependent protease with chaperone function
MVAPLLAALFVVVFLIPSYLYYEPRVTPEIVSKKLAALATISCAGLMFAAWRTLRSWFATRNLRREWLRNSEQIELQQIEIPAFRIAHAFPVIAVVGHLRPRLFVAENVLRSLSGEELAAAVAHERGHLSARDNFKRTLLQICGDTLFFAPFGRPLDRLWANTAEAAADEFAAQQSAAAALNLASALVTIAKMVPAGRRASVPVGAYLVGVEEMQGVKARISRLIEISSSGLQETNRSRWLRLLPPTSLATISVLAALLAANGKVLLSVHAIVERAVNLLC